MHFHNTNHLFTLASSLYSASIISLENKSYISTYVHISLHTFLPTKFRISKIILSSLFIPSVWTALQCDATATEFILLVICPCWPSLPVCFGLHRFEQSARAHMQVDRIFIPLRSGNNFYCISFKCTSTLSSLHVCMCTQAYMCYFLNGYTYLCCCKPLLHDSACRDLGFGTLLIFHSGRYAIISQWIRHLERNVCISIFVRSVYSG